MKLISFLGLGEAVRDNDGKPTGDYFYHRTTYRFNQDPNTDITDTCYVARAIAQGYQIEEEMKGESPVIHKVDEVVLLATSQAEKVHRDKISIEFEECGLPEPLVEQVPFGSNSKEQWQQFEAILKHIPDDSSQRVILDITHGFRSQPFFAAAVINYVRATRSIDETPQMHILYGEFNKEARVSNVWDLTTFINLLDWSNSIQGFMKTGHGASLAALVKRENTAIQKSSTEDRPRALSKLAASIKAFSENIAAVRVPKIIKGAKSEPGSARNVLDRIELSIEEVQRHFKPLYPLLEKLRNQLSDVPADSLFTQQGYRAMLALARIYVEYERYPEAAIILREAWVSLHAESGKTDQELLTREGRKKAETNWYEKEESLTIDTLSTVRNDIQHGGFRADPKPPGYLIEELGQLLEAFENKLG